MFAKVVCKRGVKVVDSAKVKPQSKVKDSMTPEEAARAAWDDLDDGGKITKFNEWAYENNADSVVYENDESTMNELFSAPMDAVRAIFFGHYQFSDPYMVFNGYANLDSYDDVVSDYIEDYFMDELIEWMVSNEDFGAYEDEVNGDEDEDEDED